MSTLTPMSDLVRDRNYDLGGDHSDIVSQPAYGTNNERVGTVRELLTEDGGKIRSLVIEVGNWFTSKQVVIPVGMARVEDDGVHFDSLTKEQAKGMTEYVVGQEYSDTAQVADIRTLKGTGSVSQVTANTATAADHDQDAALFTTPMRLQLLEQRLLVNKEKYVAGSVQIGKKVETHTENVKVELSHEEVVIHRTPVADARPVEGTLVLGEATQDDPG